jgi:hypothetical protein
VLGADTLPENLDVAINEATWFGLTLRPDEHEIADNARRSRLIAHQRTPYGI